jgi:SAM-dependent methyltransferase
MTNNQFSEPTMTSTTPGSEYDPCRAPQHWVHQRTYLTKYDNLLTTKLKRYLGKRLLEVGCGVGTMTRYFLDRELVVALDLNDDNINAVKTSFSGQHNLVCLVADITTTDLPLQSYQLDSVLCANVLEHLEDDRAALRQLFTALKPGGKMVIVTPAHQRLFNHMDYLAGHVRRYSQADLEVKVKEAGFSVEKVWHLNLSGALGWFFNGNVLRRSTIPDWQLQLFDRFAMLFALIDQWLRIPFGLSLVLVVNKPETVRHTDSHSN